MKDRIITFDKHISEISTVELNEKFAVIRKKNGEYKKSELMRSLIMNEKEFGTCTYDRTLRSLWYSFIKPTLDRLGQLTDNDEKTIDGWDSNLSRYLSELVKDGKLTYADLHILDESRSRDVKPYYSFSPCRNIVIAVEKDTVYKFVQDIGNLLGCSCYSGKGFSSLGAMESLIRDVRNHSDKPPDVIRILILSDYDPAGLEIAGTIEDQARIMVKALGMECDVICERIGIVPDQLTEEELKNNWYSPKGDMEKWLKETGGINGQPKGLELDALSPDRIREIFAKSKKPH